jgi:ADP-heptose:LPS heptosyltransferase
VIRSKLGDSLIAFAVVQQYAKQFPGSDIYVLMRSAYAQLVQHEPGIHVVPFAGRVTLYVQLLKLRFVPTFDALAVLWAFGPVVRTIAYGVRARRKVYIDGRFGALFHAWPAPIAEERQVDPFWRTAQCLAPDLLRPVALALPGLQAKLRVRTQPQAIGIVPIADEARRTLGVEGTRAVIRLAQRENPGAPVWLLLNPSDRFAAGHLAAHWGDEVVVRSFSSAQGLLDTIASLKGFYGIDSGLYHLCAALGMPCTVLFGPTPPHKNSMPAQSNLTRSRLQALGNVHCEEKACDQPQCINAVAMRLAGLASPIDLSTTPTGCPMRSYDCTSCAATRE